MRPRNPVVIESQPPVRVRRLVRLVPRAALGVVALLLPRDVLIWPDRPAPERCADDKARIV